MNQRHVRTMKKLNPKANSPEGKLFTCKFMNFLNKQRGAKRETD